MRWSSPSRRSLPAFSGIGGPVYLAGALVLNALFVRGAWRVWRRDAIAAHADRYRVEKRFFGFSIVYLTLHFVLLLAEAGPARARPARRPAGRCCSEEASRCDRTATKSSAAAAAATSGSG